jgi:hypothetical protein
MESRTEGRSRLLIVLIATIVAVIIWLLSVYYAYDEFNNTRLNDPLAGINSLVPLYYIAIAVVALSIVACLLWRIGNKYLHLSLLVIFAAMLWLTPYLLTGFVRLPDGPWHVGTAMRIPEILDGEVISFSEYAWNFPLSFIFHFSSVEVMGIEPLTYIYLYPLFCMLLFVFLCYVLITRFFDSRAALLAMLLAIPGLHYIQLHASPHTFGAILMLTTLLLLATRGTAARIVPIALIIIVIIIAAHPTTPLLVAIFLAAALLVGAVYSRRVGRLQIILAGVLVVCIAGWSCWFLFHPIPPEIQAHETDIDWRISENLFAGLTGDFGVGGEYITGTKFIYSNIYTLNRWVYYLYAAFGMICLVYVAAKSYFNRTGVRDWLFRAGGLKKGEALLCLSLLPLFILTFMLAGLSHVLIETGLTYIILALSCIIASVVIRSHWIDSRTVRFSIPVLILFLTLSSPIVAYSIDAYSNFPRSERAGLEFIAEQDELGDRSIFGLYANQLALFAPQSLYERRSLSPIDLNTQSEDVATVDLAMFRNTVYYYIAMRIDRSFEENRHFKYLADIESAGYTKTYSSPTFDIYVRNNTS